MQNSSFTPNLCVYAKFSCFEQISIIASYKKSHESCVHMWPSCKTYHNLCVFLQTVTQNAFHYCNIHLCKLQVYIGLWLTQRLQVLQDPFTSCLVALTTVSIGIPQGILQQSHRNQQSKPNLFWPHLLHCSISQTYTFYMSEQKHNRLHFCVGT